MHIPTFTLHGWKRIGRAIGERGVDGDVDSGEQILSLQLARFSALRYHALSAYELCSWSAGFRQGNKVSEKHHLGRNTEMQAQGVR